MESNQSFEERKILNAFWNALYQLFGEYGASQAGLYLIEYNKERKIAVVRCSNKALSMVKASIASITRINNELATIHILRVSGTLKAVHKGLL